MHTFIRRPYITSYTRMMHAKMTTIDQFVLQLHFRNFIIFFLSFSASLPIFLLTSIEWPWRESITAIKTCSHESNEANESEWKEWLFDCLHTDSLYIFILIYFIFVYGEKVFVFLLSIEHHSAQCEWRRSKYWKWVCFLRTQKYILLYMCACNLFSLMLLKFAKQRTNTHFFLFIIASVLPFWANVDRTCMNANNDAYCSLFCR